MSPYRQPQPNHPAEPRPRRAPGRGVGITVMLASAFSTLVLTGAGLRSFALLPILGVLGGAWLALRGEGAVDAHARLARLTWHRGKPVTATLLAMGMVSPRCSPKRVARYRAINQAKVIEAGIPDPLPWPRPGQVLVTKIVEKILRTLGDDRAS